MPGYNRNTVILFLLISSLGLLPSCLKDKAGQQTKKPPTAVLVAEVQQRTVPVQLTAIGTVESIRTIQVKSQVGGVLLKADFREGQDVKINDLLFTIDPRPYETQVKQAEAVLAKDRAQMENAREEARRYEQLVSRGYVAKDQYEQYRTAALALEAAVEADRAVLENAKLQLKYCYIRSPLTGRTGNLLADEGNLIKASADTAMVTINQMQPIYATFSLPEQHLPELQKHMASGRLAVAAYLSKEDKTPETGVITFIDNAVDTATGTIKLKGTFPNAQRRLWPGQFVHVVVTLKNRPDAIVVPTAAVQTGQKGQYVFVVKKNNTADIRPVTAEMTTGSDTVIESGLAKGELVVTDGQMRLASGAAVEIKKPEQQTDKVPQPSVENKKSTLSGP